MIVVLVHMETDVCGLYLTVFSGFMTLCRVCHEKSALKTHLLLFSVMR